LGLLLGQEEADYIRRMGPAKVTAGLIRQVTKLIRT
jgi:hypothetical protein